MTMLLREWMRITDTNDNTLAIQLGVDRSSVTRYRNGTARPGWDVIEAIAKLTKGAVMPNDFLTPLQPDQNPKDVP